MVFQINNNQIEVNCRRLYLYNKISLNTDEMGTLHYQKRWYSCVPIFKHKDYSASQISDGIPAWKNRSRNIRSTVLNTLTGMCAEMRHKKIPICMFLIPGVSSSNCTYERLAKKIIRQFHNDDEIKQAAQHVINIFNSIDYSLAYPKKLRKHEINQINKYVTFRLCSANPVKVDLPSKEQYILYTIQAVQNQISENKIWDVNGTQYRELEWITSGKWQNPN